jgi:hypothetical protein
MMLTQLIKINYTMEMKMADMERQYKLPTSNPD